MKVKVEYTEIQFSQSTKGLEGISRKSGRGHQINHKDTFEFLDLEGSGGRTTADRGKQTTITRSPDDGKPSTKRKRIKKEKWGSEYNDSHADQVVETATPSKGFTHRWCKLNI